jgi:hypothetical protein
VDIPAELSPTGGLIALAKARRKVYRYFMRLLYTFIIDADPKFLVQARVLLASLLGSGVPATQIIANITPECGVNGHALATSFRVESVTITPQIDGRFCNKIGQLLQLADRDFDVLVACDTDLAILEPLDRIARVDAIRAKRVDSPNPPVEILEELRPLFKISTMPEIVTCSCSPESTYRLNCNGGLIMIPRRFVLPLGREWLSCAKFLDIERHRLQEWGNHLDQVSWAFAMMRLGYAFEELPIEYNFPTIIARSVPASTYGCPVVLHHHDDLDEFGAIRLTGIPTVDNAIRHANEIIRTSR